MSTLSRIWITQARIMSQGQQQNCLRWTWEWHQNFFIMCRNLFFWLRHRIFFFWWNNMLSSVAAILLRIIYCEVRGREQEALWSLCSGYEEKSLSAVEEPGLDLKLFELQFICRLGCTLGKAGDRQRWTSFLSLSSALVWWCPFGCRSWAELAATGPCKWGWPDVLFHVLSGERKG